MNSEYERRRADALAAIRQSAGTTGAEDGIDLFISHHLEQMAPAYWQQHLGTARPDASAVMGLLVCRSSWGQDDLENFDFTLPGDATQYVVCVHFDSQGVIDGISMES